MDQLGPVLGDTAFFVLLADHEAGDVLQEDDGKAPRRAQFDEMGTLEG